MNVKPIVAGTDGSEESLRAVELGGQARPSLRAAPLRIVSAAPLPPGMTALQVRPDRDHVADFIRSANATGPCAAAVQRAARVAPGLVIDDRPGGRRRPPRRSPRADPGAPMLVRRLPRGRGVHGADAGIGQPVRGRPTRPARSWSSAT